LVIENETTPPDAALALRLLDGSPDGLLLVDNDGRIVLANRSATSIFGYSGDELVGRSVDVLVPDEHRRHHVGHRQHYAEAPERRPMGTDLQLFGQHRNRHLFPVEISLSPISIEGAVHTVATVRDTTERQEASARLLLHEDRERIARDLHDLVIQRLFAAGMSLQSVTNLIESPVARDRVIEVTDELDETVRAVRAAIFAVGTHDEFQSLTAHLHRLVHERSRHLGFSPDLVIVGAVDDLPGFVADQLVATLTEAVSNVARHADATDATIRISVIDGAVRLVVRDNGRGIDTKPKSLGGLSNLMWRAAELGGSCSIAPVEPSGTELVWQVPT
jgi:two-component system sensor histidine kinase DevS